MKHNQFPDKFPCKHGHITTDEDIERSGAYFDRSMSSKMTLFTVNWKMAKIKPRSVCLSVTIPFHVFKHDIIYKK